jgi:uncharacterized membrane-anchored protein YjiN (DUF445 family)
MRKQTGLRMNAQVWEAYRDLCSRENLRPNEPIEEFLRLVLHNGSASAVLNMMQGMVKAKSGGFEAYARVLLDWYKNGQLWIRVTDETEAPVEHMLLHALKDVADPQLCKEIQETLMIRPRKQAGNKERRKKSTVKETPVAPSTSKRIEEIKKQVAGQDIDAEQAQEMLESIRRIREELKGDKKGRSKKR